MASARRSSGEAAVLFSALLAAAVAAGCSGSIVAQSSDAQVDRPGDGPAGAEAGRPDSAGGGPDAGAPVDAAGGTEGGPTGDDAGVAPDGPPASTAFRVVGYWPSWVSGESQIQYELLTHINYAFALPTASGGITGLDSTAQLDNLVGLAHARGVTVSLSVGGWNDGDDSAFHTLAADSGTRAAFVETLAGFAAAHDLDGVDIDWEYPDPGGSADDYAALMSELGASLHGAGRLLTAAVVSAGGQGGGVPDSVFAVVDFLNLMAYDGGTPHSPYSLAVASLDYWLGRGLPPSKAVLGVPFYGREPYTSYADLVAMDSTAPYKDQVGNVYYNGIPTMQEKTALAADRGSGIMIWELSMDTLDDTSLLRAIHGAIPAGWTMP